MPPRYVYWTIIVDGQPTAFRSGSLEDIMPTFNRLKEKQPTAELKWFQHGKLWASRHDAQDFMRARGDRGRERDPRQNRDQGSGTRDQGSGTGDQGADRPERAWNAKPDWKTRSTFKPRGDKPAFGSAPAGKPAWVPKGASPKPQDTDRGEKPEWRPKSPAPARRTFDDRDDRSSFAKADDRPAGQARGNKPPEWKPKGSFKPRESGHSSGWGEKPGWKSKDDRGEKRSFTKSSEGKPAWKPKGDGGKPEWKPKGDAGGKPEWKPKGTFKPKEPGHRPSARDEARASFRPKSYTPKEDDGRTRASRVQSRNDKLDWKPASAKSSARPAPAERRGDGPNGGFAKSDPDAPKRKWVPKEEYKKSMGIEVKRDDKWRPGGVHRDPKQKYKDAKKAKWGRFKEAIRSRSTKPKKRDE